MNQIKNNKNQSPSFFKEREDSASVPMTMVYEKGELKYLLTSLDDSQKILNRKRCDIFPCKCWTRLTRSIELSCLRQAFELSHEYDVLEFIQDFSFTRVLRKKGSWKTSKQKTSVQQAHSSVAFMLKRERMLVSLCISFVLMYEETLKT